MCFKHKNITDTHKPFTNFIFYIQNSFDKERLSHYPAHLTACCRIDRALAVRTIFTFQRQRRKTTLSYLRFPIGHVREREKNHFPRVITAYRFSAFNSLLKA